MIAISRRMAILILMALTTMMWVFAATSVEVRSGGTVAVVNSADALLAVAPGTGDANSTGIAAFVDGELVLDFRKGSVVGKTYGVQPGATYLFHDLVTVTNHAGRPVQVSVAAQDGAGHPPTDLLAIQDQFGSLLVGVGAGPVSLASEGTLLLSFQWKGISLAGKRTDLVLTISAE